MLDRMVPVMGPRWPHPLVTLGVFAGATRRIRLVNTVIVLGYHHPVELAKMISTLDWLSGGRAIVGLGVGYLRREFAIMGGDHANRGEIANEMIEAMIELWSSDEPAYQGKHFQFDRIAFEPRPVQKPHPPIWIGGTLRDPRCAAPRPTATAGSRGRSPASSFPKSWNTSMSGGNGTARGPFEVIMPLFEAKMDMRHNVLEPPKLTTDKGQILAEIDALKQAGATGTTFATTPTSSVGDYIERLEAFASDIFPAIGK